MDAKLAQIAQEFDGTNAAELARKFGITERAMRRLLACHRGPNAAPN